MSQRHTRRSAVPLRILLVDDDEGEYLLVRDLLARFSGRAVALDWVTASTEALRVFRETGAHDIYLIDYKLLDHTGIDVLRDLRASGCRAPLLMLTTMADDAVDRQAMRAGAADYLIKSEMTRALLHRAIRHALERAEFAKALRDSEERYRSLARNFPDGAILVLDHEGRVVVAEGMALPQLSGTADGAAVENALARDAFPGGFGELLVQSAATALSGKSVTVECEHAGRRWLLSAAPQNRFGSSPQAVLVAKDLSALRPAGDRLMAACAALEARGALPDELRAALAEVQRQPR
jgi:CheY-like chemotaxis protein